MTTKPPVKRQAWKIGRRFYITQRAALRHYAILRLGDKYGWFSDIGDVAGYECFCPDDPDGPPYSIYEPSRKDYPGCPIHDRRTGYFARVATRFARMWRTEP